MGPCNDQTDLDRMVDLTVVGEHEANVDNILAVMDKLHIKHRLIPRAKYGWLVNKSKGAGHAREMDLERKFDTCIVLRQRSDGDTVGMVDLAVVGEREENVDEVLAIIDGLCVKRRLISRELYLWLVSKAKGAECAREMDLERKFDTCILLYPLDDKDDPSCIVELVVLGEREENVDEVFAAITIAAPDS